MSRIKPNYSLSLKPDLDGVLGSISCERISDLCSSEAELLGHHLGHHPDSLYVMASGVPAEQLNQYGLSPTFDADRVIAFEWGRHETSPKIYGGEQEKEVNSYRYLGAVSELNGRVEVWDVTEKNERKPGSIQVGDHHMDLPQVFAAYFGES